MPFATICDIVEGAIIKRRAMGRHFGVAVLAEGLIDKLDPAELAELEDVERDEHGHVRFAEVDLARKVKAEVQGRLSERGLRVTITNKNVGYELRCADPIPFDAEYCRDLGYGAVRFLLGGGSGAMVSIQGGRLVPIPFDDLVEPETGKTKVRLVDIAARVPSRPRLHDPARAEDFAHAAWVDRLADAAHLTPGAFRQRFEHTRLDRRRKAASSHAHQTHRHRRRRRSRARHERRHQRASPSKRSRSDACRSASTTASTGSPSATPTNSTS